MKKLLAIVLLSVSWASAAVAQETSPMTDAALLGADWLKVADVETDTVFIRSDDSREPAKTGAWVRRIHKNGEADTIEHYKPMTCDGDAPLVIRDVKATVSEDDGSLRWRKKLKTMNGAIAGVLRDHIFCPVQAEKQAVADPAAAVATAGDFTTVEYLDTDGTGAILDSCSGRKTFTTFEQVIGREGGYTFIASCQTGTDAADWLATKRESFVLTSKGRRATETFYRIGKDCRLVSVGGAAGKWVCQHLNNVNYLKINTVEPVTDANKDRYFAPIWVKAK